MEALVFSRHSLYRGKREEGEERSPRVSTINRFSLDVENERAGAGRGDRTYVARPEILGAARSGIYVMLVRASKCLIALIALWHDHCLQAVAGHAVRYSTHLRRQHSLVGHTMRYISTEQTKFTANMYCSIIVLCCTGDVHRSALPTVSPVCAIILLINITLLLNYVELAGHVLTRALLSLNPSLVNSTTHTKAYQ